jgi:hypothetical protein
VAGAAGAPLSPPEDEVDLDTLYVKPTFYVRPERTLVVCSVGRRVGGPGSALWASGWSLGLGGRDLAGVAIQDAPLALMQAFCSGEELRRMSPEARSAWMRTWRHAG